MINDKIAPTGELEIVLRDANGNIKTQTTVPNLVVTVGKAVIANRLSGVSLTGANAVMSHMAIGNINTGAAAGNTALLGETTTTTNRPACTASVSGSIITYTSTFGAGVGTGNIYEAGIFNALTGGTMLARTVFSLITKDADDSLTITWKITIS